MQSRTAFDEGLFVLSFSLALGLAALIIPARGATLDATRAKIADTYAPFCVVRHDDGKRLCVEFEVP